MTEAIPMPGGRSVQATLDPARDGSIDDVGEIDDADGVTAGRDTVVIVCPPHP